MRLHHLLSFLGILISLTVNAQQQQPSKFQSNILRQSPNCRKRVTSDASIQLQYVAKTLESDEIVDKKIIDLSPARNNFIYVSKGLEHEILGMCIGEIRRLIVPAALHVSNDGQIASKAMIYDIEVLEVDSAPLLTPVFWFVIGSIAVAYVIFSRLSAMADIKKDKTQ
ncbi:hypothetical protein HMPREF1544_02576 [Mucor circinelloides 1006PhL]|uniref:PPIase FKBP-type domain-containing protein n=1 Tax=Mucor circinelloides f. circinelloides (strain 1006PhL) TaxID=1220926 RepID=S2JK13_MUCC1|nr:hypothetical protein HMPREF1544_02576 [Mucor circinelloides 1006PhL]